MTNRLPLPEPVHGFYSAPMFTADQMHTHAAAQSASDNAELRRWKSTNAPRLEALQGLLEHAQIEAAKGGEAIASLDSERAANAILTGENEKLRAELATHQAYIRELCRAIDAAADFAGTVAGGASWWDDVWAEHVAELDIARAALGDKP